MKILLIEDNLDIIKGLKYTLENENYIVDYKTCLSGVDLDEFYDLYILDIGLPDGNGYDFYKNNLNDKKVIFLTANTDEDILVSAIENGAEDYLTKPFSNRELIARINKILKKNKVITVKDITYDYSSMKVTNKGNVINLSSLELKIFNLLMTNLNKIITRDMIINNIWNWTGNDVYDNTVTVYMKRLREKLGSDIITTVKGVGYRIDYEK